MAIRSNRLAESTGDVVTGTLRDSEDLLVINPPLAAMREVVDGLRDTQDPPRVRLFADPVPLKELLEDFVTAATVADLAADGTLAVRTLQSVPKNALLVSPETVVALVSGPERAAGLTETDDDFVARTYGTFDERWESAPEYTLQTPPLSEVRETLRSELGEGVAADFDRLLETAADGELDEVAISLLAAARNETLLYDVSRWGEDVGLASKATFSRTKTALEEAGLLETEKVPIDVGRPRLRLRLPAAFEDEPVEAVAREAGPRL